MLKQVRVAAREVREDATSEDLVAAVAFARTLQWLLPDRLPLLDRGSVLSSTLDKSMRKLTSGERLALPAPGKQSTALVMYMPPLTPDEWLHRQEEKPWLLMRPPTVVILPLEGYACDCAAWRDKCRWEVQA